MVQSQYSLSWNSHKSSICNGFSLLQQNGEFVDMTLAADGHLVKVHQVLMALASPYLKELISSAPCQHPVIFLNNVSHKTLCLLLEYIYTGEALIPAESLNTFVETAKALHIKGLENMDYGDNMTVKMAMNVSQMEDNQLCHVSGTKRMAIPTSEGTGQVTLPAAARKIFIKRDISGDNEPSQKLFKEKSLVTKDELLDYSDAMDDTGAQDSDDGYKQEDGPQTSLSFSKESASNLQFTVSIRGSLQVILNRYIYNLHSVAQRGGLRRWRCVDYRNNKCSAFVVTKGNIVLNRANLHNHPFHDKKILAKIEKKAVFSALSDVEGYKEKEYGKNSDNDEATMEQDDYTTLEYRQQLNEVPVVETKSHS